MAIGRYPLVNSKILEKSGNGFSIEQEQVAYKGSKKKETVVLKEVLKVSVSSTEEANIIEYHLTQTNVSGVKLELPAYRYGGPMAYRGPHSWTKQNSNYAPYADFSDRDGSFWRAFERYRFNICPEHYD